MLFALLEIFHSCKISVRRRVFGLSRDRKKEVSAHIEFLSLVV